MLTYTLQHLCVCVCLCVCDSRNVLFELLRETKSKTLSIIFRLRTTKPFTVCLIPQGLCSPEHDEAFEADGGSIKLGTSEVHYLPLYVTAPFRPVGFPERLCERSESVASMTGCRRSDCSAKSAEAHRTCGVRIIVSPNSNHIFNIDFAGQ